MSDTQVRHEPSVNQESIQYLTFYLNNELLGIESDSIKEVIQMQRMTEVPLIADFIRGIINLRGIIIPVVDLCRLIFGNHVEITENTQLIIFEIEHNENTIILAATIDTISEVCNILKEEIHPAPDLGSKIKPEYIKAIGTPGKNIIALLNIDKIFDIDELKRLNTYEIDESKLYTTESEKTSRIEYQEENEELFDSLSNKYVTFILKENRYGIPIEETDEVINMIDMINIPGVMPYMKGIIELRGKAVPVIDLRIRCGFEERQQIHDPVIVIVIIKGIHIGIIVDAISSVIEIPDQDLQDTIHYCVDMERDFIKCMGKSDEGLLVILDIEKILTNQELELIAKNGKEWDKKIK